METTGFLDSAESALRDLERDRAEVIRLCDLEEDEARRWERRAMFAVAGQHEQVARDALSHREVHAGAERRYRDEAETIRVAIESYRSAIEDFRRRHEMNA